MQFYSIITFLMLLSYDQINTQKYDYDENHLLQSRMYTAVSSSTRRLRNQHQNQHHHRTRIEGKRRIVHRNQKVQQATTSAILTSKTISQRPSHESTEFIFNANDQLNQYDAETFNPQQQQSQVKVIDLTVKVGDTAMLKCEINTTNSGSTNPGVIWMQGRLGSVLTLNKNRITVDNRFQIVQTPFDLDNKLASFETQLKRQTQQTVKQIINELDYYHLKITNVQLYDDNEYACETSITKNNEDEPFLHSLIRLHVTQSPNFIESLTSDNNLVVVENGDLDLKCFAIGKPAPKIRWYQIEEDNGIIRDLNHETTTFSLTNVTKNQNSKYECIADNGILPSVSKKFSVSVYYLPILKAIRKTVIQNLDKTVLLGCVVKSNPESTFLWYKTKITTTSNNKTTVPEFLQIDTSNLKYHIHTFKQLNQTVSYLKIKQINLQDYLSYKCEATNLVGKQEAFIDLLSHHHHHNRNHHKHHHVQVFSSTEFDDHNYDDDYSAQFNARTSLDDRNDSKYEYLNTVSKFNKSADRAAAAVSRGFRVAGLVNSILAICLYFKLFS